MVSSCGISHRRITELPIAIIDFETTGLTPGLDRVVEVSVVRREPDGSTQLVLDTLVNPTRPMAASDIHGITDQDVAEAPCFREMAGELVRALSDCVVAAYNVYFDIKFLNFEFRNIGVNHEPPHFCLMYFRPMLGLGSRCKLAQACHFHGIDHEVTHTARHDAVVSGKLLGCYLEKAREQGVDTYGDLAKLKSYKFVASFRNAPFPSPSAFKLPAPKRLCSRSGDSVATSSDPVRRTVASYWDDLCTVVADLEITDQEVEQLNEQKASLGLREEQVRALHARAFTSAIAQFTDDRWLDDREVRKLQRLHQCLAKLGWAPGL